MPKDRVRRTLVATIIGVLVAASIYGVFVVALADVERPARVGSGDGRRHDPRTSAQGTADRSYAEQSQARVFVARKSRDPRDDLAGLVAPSENLGRLRPEERIQAVRTVDRYVAGRKKFVERFYAGLRPGRYETLEEQRFREAECVAWLEYAMAFRTALDEGSYLLLRSDEGPRHWPERFAVLNAGVVSRGGQLAHVKILADRKRYGLDRVDEYLERHRRAWLGRVARDFNGLPEDRRRARLSAGYRFPGGIRVDEERALLVVEPDR